MAVIDIHSVEDIRYGYIIRNNHSVEVIYSNRFYTYWISITYKRKEKEIKKEKEYFAHNDIQTFKYDTIFFTRKFFYFFLKRY